MVNIRLLRTSTVTTSVLWFPSSRIFWSGSQRRPCSRTQKVKKSQKNKLAYQLTTFSITRKRKEASTVRRKAFLPQAWATSLRALSHSAKKLNTPITSCRVTKALTYHLSCLLPPCKLLPWYGRDAEEAGCLGGCKQDAGIHYCSC